MRILLIEDEEDLALAVASALRREGYAVDTACDGTSGNYLGESYPYDLLILDLNLPGMDGLEICQNLRSKRPGLLILILTSRGQPEERIRGLDLGADDYLVKPFHMGELTARIRALLRRDLRVREPVLVHLDLRLDPAGRQAWRGSRPLDLTRKELAILEYFLRRPGEVISQEELLVHIWDENVDLFTNVVRVHINSLRKKLGEITYIETVIGQGYRLAGQPSESAQGEAR